MSWRFARTPKWIVRHVLVVVLVIAMMEAGSWQLRRLDEKQDAKDLIEARLEEPPAPVAELVPLDAATDDERIDQVVQRPATARGTYRHEDSVVVENRSYNGASGGWALTPLVLDDGSAVLVLRGFVGFDGDGRIVAPEPPAGEVEVEGVLQASQRRGRLGATDPDAGKLEVLARVDLDRFAAQVGYPVRPAYLQLSDSRPAEPEPAPGAAPLVALGVPEPDLGPHLSYAVQWFIFATIGVVGYGLILRRAAVDEAKADRAAAAAGGPPR